MPDYMVDFGIFSINIVGLLDFFDQPILYIISGLITIGGWLVFAYMMIFVALVFFQEYKQNKYSADWKWILFAVDVPLLNAQSPKAVEQMFAHLAGAFDKPNLADKYHDGYKQRWFSMEIVSIEGYIQFLIRTEEKFRDLVEASVYAQYPEAEITEVEDYVNDTPDNYPNETHDLWMADFGLEQDDAYPIRTYEDFQDNLVKDEPLKDPMGAFLESFSRIGPGEQMWFQVLVEPVSSDWKEKSIKKVKELIGDTSSGKDGGNKMADYLSKSSLKAIESIGDQVFGREASFNTDDSSREPQNKLQFLTPGQTKVLEAIEEKIRKIGFKTKIRGGYIARKEVFKPERGVNLMIGAINQFNILSANSIVPKSGVGASYFFKNQRSATKKSLMIQAYKKRKINFGANSFILNIEELATIWHFPMANVKAPLVQRSGAKQTENYITDSGDFGYGDDVDFG